MTERGLRRTVVVGLTAGALAVLVALVVWTRGSGSASMPVAAAGTDEADLGADSTARWLRGRPFHQDARALTLAEQKGFAAGAEVFQHPIEVTVDGLRQPFSELPGTADGADATGPAFVQSACITCHVDGTEGTVDLPGPGLVVRVADPGDADTGAPHHGLGIQLQTDTVDGSTPEGGVRIRWEELDGSLGDGTTYRLRRPLGSVTGDIVERTGPTAVSLRVAPPLLGLGMLEAVPRQDLEPVADPDDDDGDGISGRVPRGRFGWKGAQPTVRSQTVTALSHDLGVTTGESPDPCDDRPVECSVVAGADPELWGQPFDDLLLYTAAIAVPRARGIDRPEVRRGASVFTAIGCAACHSPTQRTGPAPIASNGDRTIHPYTDLLLHDMGPGLDDGVGESGARSPEWRTAPLWGLGLRDEVYGAGRYLHDGRAATIEEAILWHGGEAATARDRYAMSDDDERRSLIEFLRAL